MICVVSKLKVDQGIIDDSGLSIIIQWIGRRNLTRDRNFMDLKFLSLVKNFIWDLKFHRGKYFKYFEDESRVHGCWKL